MKYLPIIGEMLDKKTAFLDLAIEELPELENLLSVRDSNHVPAFVSIVSLLDAYPMGICPAPAGKGLVYCADAFVSTAKAALWKEELTPADAVLVGELLEDALECLSDLKALCKGGKEGHHE